MKTILTLAKARSALRAEGMIIKKLDGEYQVKRIWGRPDEAYFTDDLEDAVNTGVLMGKDFREKEKLRSVANGLAQALTAVQGIDKRYLSSFTASKIQEIENSLSSEFEIADNNLAAAYRRPLKPITELSNQAEA